MYVFITVIVLKERQKGGLMSGYEKLKSIDRTQKLLFLDNSHFVQ